jgi:predicted metal-dependent phosphoesterase TrpH
MKKYDLHVHTIYSKDSINKIEDLIKKYLKLGFSGFAITDHNTIEGYKKIKENKVKDLQIIGGCEYLTTKGEIIGLFIEEKIESMDFFEVCDNIHEQGGFVIIPHPFDKSKKNALNLESLTKEELKQIDAIEVFNASALNKAANDLAENFATKNNFAKTAGSDSHIIFSAANAYTIIEDDIDLEIAIKSKKTFTAGKLSPPYYRGIPTIIKRIRKILNK